MDTNPPTNQLDQKSDNSEKRQRFVESVNKRTNNVLHSLKVLGNCANQNLYDYSPEDIEKIFTAVESVVAETKAKFSFWDDKEFKL